jgi:putative Ca2+/H+ antiporter (TMEM165/GDT1 family)
MTAFWVSLFFVLIAEMGDKTQLVALAYATRYTTGKVMAGVFGSCRADSPNPEPGVPVGIS